MTPRSDRSSLRANVESSSRPSALARYILLVGLAAAHLWCADSEDSSGSAPPSSQPEAGMPETSTADAGAPPDAAPPPVCTASFCRVGVPGGDVRAIGGVWARSGSDVWIVGSAGFAAHYDGAEWKPVPTGTKQTLFSVWGSSDGAVWATSSGHAFLRLDRATADGVEALDGGFAGIVNAVSGGAPNDVYAVGSVDKPLFSEEPLELANIWRWLPDADGGAPSWRAVSPACEAYGALGCPTLFAVWVESEQVQWFAGERGKVYRTATTDAGAIGDGVSGRLRLLETSSGSLRALSGLWGFGPSDIWAVGAQGVIRHWTGGTEWTIAESPTNEDLRGVWGARPDDVWAVGDHGTVLHWNGQAWSRVDVPVNETNRPRLYGIAGVGRDVWIVGENTLLRSTTGGAP